ncbi:MAG: M23 family metallopeptidase [Actinomycetota bacterium]
MTTSIRRFALALIAIAIVTAQITLAAPSASAAEPQEADDFIMKAFPHQSSLVHFSDTFGAPRSGGRRHKGTDILSPKGTWIVAVEDGIVERMSHSRLSGYAIKIRHADGWSSVYMHLDNDTQGTDDGDGGPETAYVEDLAEGDFVHAGDVIGFVGDSGNAERTVSHTHFELRYDNKAVNSYPYLAVAWEHRLNTCEKQRIIL